MSDATYAVTGQVWRSPGNASWHFLTLPHDVADEIHARFAGVRASGRATR